MIIKRPIGEKGQVVIPKDIREYLGLRKGENVVFEIKNNEVVLKQEQDAEEFLRDFLNVPKIKRKLTARKFKKIMEEQYNESVY